jgi:hypothetical protein
MRWQNVAKCGRQKFSTIIRISVGLNIEKVSPSQCTTNYGTKLKSPYFSATLERMSFNQYMAKYKTQYDQSVLMFHRAWG